MKRVGRAAGRHDHPEHTHAIQTQMLEAASVCPAAVEYSRAEQVCVAEEVAALPEGARIVDRMADYAVLRAQVRVCR
jgi:hypothetical protein